VNRQVFRAVLKGRSGKKEREKNSIIAIFFMSLFDREDLLDNHQFLLLIDLKKTVGTSGETTIFRLPS
jgi:hypothetical protein